MDRAEHLQWAKDRALEYARRGDAQNAMASMESDLNDHPELANHAGIQLGIMMLMAGQLNSTHETVRFIEGFN